MPNYRSLILRNNSVLKMTATCVLIFLFRLSFFLFLTGEANSTLNMLRIGASIAKYSTNAVPNASTISDNDKLI